MGEREEHDPHDPRGGRTNPTGPQGPADQEDWQKSKSGEEATREASTKAGDHSEDDSQGNE